jgi:hypothetical protein
MVADGAAQHGIARLQRVEHGSERGCASDFNRHLAADVRQRSQVVGEDNPDHVSF